MVKKLFSYLKNSGIDVYLPGKKSGKCTAPYAVVKEGKTQISATGRGIYTYFSVFIISPIESYGLSDTLTAQVKSTLADTKFKFCESDTEEAGDDFDGYKKILTYRIFKPLKCRLK